MKKLLYYFCIPFIYGISLLPFPVLYLLSDILYVVVYKGFGYRTTVVINNLKNAFPQKNEQERKIICDQFYKHFFDLILEIFKTLTISKSELRKRVQLQNFELFEKFQSQNQSLVVVMGHLGNWEWAGARFSLEDYHQLYAIYKPLKNKYFDQLFIKLRTRFGGNVYAMKDVFRGMVKNKAELTATTFITDQTPSNHETYWTKFLSQETPIYLGAEKNSQKV